MGLKAAIQALQKAEKLKEKVQSSQDLLNDNEAWISQQQLQRIYQQVLILDLEYALDRKVEQDLWSHGFKNYIGTLQALAKDKKNLKRSESQAMLSWCLEAASGFYLTLLQDICTAFDLDLPFRRKGSVYGSGKQWKTIEELNPPHHSSCNYICQHCLVHLGDIARYRCQNRQAEAFYRHAVLPAPSNGHPYNQLALLEASRGDRLSTVFHYVRSIAVRYPFQAAATNLERTLNKSIEEKLNVEGRIKLTVSEYVSVFLKLHGLLHLGIDLQQAEKYVKLLNTSLTAHIATEGLTSWKLVQMLVINFFALHHAGSCMDANQITTFTDEQLSTDERRVKCLVTDLMAGSLSAILLPVYTLKEGDTLLEYFALPAIKLTLDWIRLDPKVLTDSAFTSRLQIWPSLCKLLNGLRPVLGNFENEKYSYVPLPEDRDLQCFLPLEKALSSLRFTCNDWKSDPPSLNKLRASRLVDFGDWLAVKTDHRLITKKASTLANDDLMLFEAVGGQQVPPSDLIRELEELSLTKLSSPAPSEGSSWGSSATGSSTPDNLLVLQGPPSPPEQAAHLDTERRAGILKPQGSLEKSREKETPDLTWSVNSTSQAAPPAVKRGRQNVAMQAIMRKVGTLAEQDSVRVMESKQVTFKSPSPTNVPGFNLSETESKPNKVPTWQHQQHHQKLQQQFKQQQMQQLKQQQQQQQQQIQHLKQQQQAPNTTSVHFPFQTPPPPIPLPQQNPRTNSMFSSNSEPNQIQHQNASAPYTTSFMSQMPFHQPPPPNPVNNPAQDKHSNVISYSNQPYGNSPLPPQYSPWQVANEPLPMPPTSWCAAENRRVTRPPGMEHSQDVPSNHSFNYLHANRLQQNAAPEESFMNWNARGSQTSYNVHPKLNVEQKPVHFATPVSRPSNATQRGDQMSMFASMNQPQARGDCENLTMFSSGPGANTFSSGPGANTFSSGPGTNAFSSVGASNTYSLFSSPSASWGTSASCGSQADSSGRKANIGVIGVPSGAAPAIGQQSLWSGPGPSPLERLLEQQKQLREGPAPKGGT